MELLQDLSLYLTRTECFYSLTQKFPIFGLDVLQVSLPGWRPIQKLPSLLDDQFVQRVQSPTSFYILLQAPKPPQTYNNYYYYFYLFFMCSINYVSAWCSCDWTNHIARHRAEGEREDVCGRIYLMAKISFVAITHWEQLKTPKAASMIL